MSDLIVTTMNDLPGYRVTEVYGEVFGLTVRSRHIGSDIGASLKGLVGGEIKGYTKMLADSRLQAIERLRAVWERNILHAVAELPDVALSEPGSGDAG